MWHATPPKSLAHRPTFRNVKKQTSYFPPVSVVPLSASTSTVAIDSAIVRPNGVPIIQCSNGVTYSYDVALATWVKLSERWLSEGSDAWQSRQRSSSTISARGIVSSIECALSTTPDPAEAEKPRPKWWSTALTLGHLETRMHGA